MTLVDVISGTRCSVSRNDLKARIPHPFLVTGLQPDRRYLVVFEDTENTNERRAIVITPSHPDENKAVRVVSVNQDDCDAVTLDVDEEDAEIDDPWRWISEMMKDHERPFVIVAHMGGQVRLSKAMETARLYLKNGGDVEQAKDHLREAYRTQWNIPFKRDVLSHFCNMMTRGGGDVGLWGRSSSSSNNDDAFECAVRKMAFEIYLEYQHSLLDPLEMIPRPLTSSASEPCCAAFTLYGSIAVLRLDLRSNRLDSSTGHVHLDRPMMSKEQWNFVEQTLKSATKALVFVLIVETPIAFTTAESMKRIRDQSKGIMSETTAKVALSKDGRYVLREDDDDDDETKERKKRDREEEINLAKQRVQILDELFCRSPKESEQLTRLFMDWQKERLASRRFLILSGGLNMCMETDLTCGLASGKQYIIGSLTAVPERPLPVPMEGIVGVKEEKEGDESSDDEEEEKTRRGPITFKHHRFRTKRSERRYCVAVAELFAQPGIRDFTGVATVIEWRKRPAIDIDVTLHFKAIPVRQGFLSASEAGKMGFWKYVEYAARQHYWWRDRLCGPERPVWSHALARVADWIDGEGPPVVEQQKQETLNVRRALASTFWTRRVRQEYDVVKSRRASVELCDCLRRIWRGVIKDSSISQVLRPIVLASPNLDDNFVMDLAMQRVERTKIAGEWDFRAFQNACEKLMIECITIRASDFSVDFERARAAERARRKEKARREREEKERIRAEKKARRDERRRAKAERARLKKEAEEKERAKVRAVFQKIRKRKN